MKILLIGDPHLKISKFDLSCRFLAWIGETVKSVSPDMVVNLGDTFDTHAILRSEVLGEFYKHVKQIVEICPYYYVIGNHDMFKPNDSKYHALQSFEVNGFTIVSNRLDVGDITFVPYIHDIKEFPVNTNKICVAHQTFVGADYGFYRPDIGVDADVVSADIIISGHIHKRQMFGKVIYPGTPFAQNADDVDQDKGVMLFDTDTYKYSFIDSPFPKWRSLEYEVSSDLSFDKIHEDIIRETNIVDNWIISITAPRAELSAYANSKQVSNLRQKVQIRFKFHYNDKQKVDRVKIKSSKVSDVVSEYIDKVYQGSIDKSIIKSKALEILTKVKLT
jgi:DNA repair exonuclease SbcCD nuclease subunit